VGTQLWRQGADGVQGTEEAGDHFGYRLAVGDFNGDGYDDLAIGAVHESREGTTTISNAGVVHILYGSANGLTSAENQIWWAQSSEVGDNFGKVLTAGDFNGDGYADLAVGVPGKDTGSPVRINAGAVEILFGSASGITAAGRQFWDRGTGADHSSEYGFSLAAGDFNGDGRDDLAVGIPYQDLPAGAYYIIDAGAVEILYGAPAGLIRRVTNDFWHQDRSGMMDGYEENDRFGWSLAAGDFDGDGYQDLAVGIPYESINAVGDQAGAVQILYGSSEGITAARNWFVHQDTAGIEGVAEPQDNFGWALASLPKWKRYLFLPLVNKM
jgi:hypothetical protein